MRDFESLVERAFKYKLLGFSDPIIEAVLLLNEARNEQPKRGIEIVDEALKLLEGKRGRKAEIVRAYAYHLKAKFLAALGKKNRALALLYEAIKRMSEYSLKELGDAILDRIRISYDLLGPSGVTREDVDEALRLLEDKDKRVEVLIYYALSKLGERDVAGALEVLSKAELEGGGIIQAEVHRLRGEILMAYTKATDLVLKEAKEALRIARDHYDDPRAPGIRAMAYKLLIRALARDERRARLVPKVIRRALLEVSEKHRNEIRSASIEAINELLKRNLGKIALDALEVLSETGIDEELRLLYARAYMITGHHKEAEKILKKLAKGERAKEALSELVKLYELTGRYDLAQRLRRVLEKIDARTGKIPCFLGMRPSSSAFS